MAYLIRRPPEPTLDEYRTRCTGLKVLTNFTEPSPREGGGGRLLKSKWKDTTGSAVVQEINQIHKSKYTNALRTDLFDGNGEDNMNFIDYSVAKIK